MGAGGQRGALREAAGEAGCSRRRLEEKLPPFQLFRPFIKCERWVGGDSLSSSGRESAVGVGGGELREGLRLEDGSWEGRTRDNRRRRTQGPLSAVTVA